MKVPVWLFLVAAVFSVNKASCQTAGVPRFYKEMILDALNTTSRQIDVTVVSELPGNITWITTNDSLITIHVTVMAASIEDIQQINLDFRSESQHVSLYISDHMISKMASSVSGGGSKQSYGTISYLVVLAFLTSAFFQDWKRLFRFFLLTAIYSTLYGMVLGAEENILNQKTVNVNIKAPRKFHYNDVRLRTRIGDISTYGADTHIKDLQCSTITGSRQGCYGCCYGNGVCSNNTCLCYQGYEESSFCARRKREDILFNHFKDPRLMQSLLASGDVIDVYGSRKSNGSVSKISFLKLKLPNGIFKLYPDETVGIRKLEDSEGVLLSTRKSVNCTILVSVRGNNKSYSIFKSENDTHCLKGIPRSNGVLYKNILNMEITNGSYYSPGKRFRDIPIHVRQCGADKPEAEVIVEIVPDEVTNSKHLSFEVKAARGKRRGDHNLRLPNVRMTHSEEMNNRTCAEVVNLLSGVCMNVVLFTTDVCGVLTQRVDGEAEGFIYGTMYSLMCSHTNNPLKEFCDKFSSNNLQNREECLPLFTQTVDIFFFDSFHVLPKAVLYDGRVLHGANTELTMYTPVLRDNIMYIDDDRPEFKITDIKVIPEDPVPKDVYRVRLEYECATRFTVIKMNVTGSDLYRNHVTCEGVADCECCTVHAAGANDAVVDTVKINITDSFTNFSQYKELVIVF